MLDAAIKQCDDVIIGNRKSARIYGFLLWFIVALVVIIGFMVAALVMALIQQTDALVKSASLAGITTAGANTSPLGNGATSGMDGLMGVMMLGSLCFFLVVITGLLRFHLKEIVKAQDMKNSFLRIKASTMDGLSKEAITSLTKTAFVAGASKDVSVHPGLEAVGQISERIIKRLDKLIMFKKQAP